MRRGHVDGVVLRLVDAPRAWALHTGPIARTEIAISSRRSNASKVGLTRSNTAKSSSVGTCASMIAPRWVGCASMAKVASGKVAVIVAQIWVTGGTHIRQGTVKVNDTYFRTGTYNSSAWRNLVMCQEVGHTLGLDHQDEDFDNPNLGTCMDYTSNPTTNQHPNTHDYAQLETIYLGHVDSINTASATQLPGSAPPAMGQIDFDTPGQWGRLVGKSRNGRQAVYELDFGQGNMVVTHVFWADPDHDAHQH